LFLKPFYEEMHFKTSPIENPGTLRKEVDGEQSPDLVSASDSATAFM
jgi:hypothetical protein